MAERSVTVGPFTPGLNNRLRPTELDLTLSDRTRARYLYGADNVDLTAEGGLKRREGFTQVLSGDMHSLWSTDDASYVVMNDELCAIDAGVTGTTVLRSGMPKLPVSYTKSPNGIVYWSNGLELRCIVNGVDLPISAAPALAPTVTVGSGALPAGLYIVAFTWTGPQGESAPTHAVQVEVPESGSINVANAAGATVWVSGPNGDHISSYGAVSSVGVLSETGRTMRMMDTAPMPPGHIVRMHQGSLVVAHDNVLFFSVPYREAVYQPVRGYIPFPEKITAIESVVNGIFICSDHTYWVGTFFDSAGLQDKLPFGAVLGSSIYSPEENKAYWQSPYGLIAGDSSGNISKLQDSTLTFAPASFGATMYRFRDGRTSVVTTRSGVQTNRAAALAWADADVIRKETSDEL